MFGAVYLPFMNNILDTEPLAATHLFWIIILGFYKVILVEAVKWWYNKKVKI
jgi:hypothetical protein